MLCGCLLKSPTMLLLLLMGVWESGVVAKVLLGCVVSGVFLCVLCLNLNTMMLEMWTVAMEFWVVARVSVWLLIWTLTSLWYSSVSMAGSLLQCKLKPCPLYEYNSLCLIANIIRALILRNRFIIALCIILVVRGTFTTYRSSK